MATYIKCCFILQPRQLTNRWSRITNLGSLPGLRGYYRLNRQRLHAGPQSAENWPLYALRSLKMNDQRYAKLRANEFVAGMVFAFSIILLRQDWLGLEKYILFVRNNWIVLPWWIWLIPLFGSLTIFVIGRLQAATPPRI